VPLGRIERSLSELREYSTGESFPPSLEEGCGSQSMAARPAVNAQEVSSIGKRRETTRNSRKGHNKGR